MISMHIPKIFNLLFILLLTILLKFILSNYFFRIIERHIIKARQTVLLSRYVFCSSHAPFRSSSCANSPLRGSDSAHFRYWRARPLERLATANASPYAMPFMAVLNIPLQIQPILLIGFFLFFFYHFKFS